MMTARPSKTCFRYSAAIAALAAMSTAPALAQTAEADADRGRVSEETGTSYSGEIIVTAQKRAERVIDVPMSIVALGADELARRNIRNTDDIATAVPGLSMQSNGYQRRIQIRGVSNSATTNIGNNALIGIYLNEADVTSSATNQLNLSAYDLERIEVLRGPQGTLYGGGSAGGTVRFITKSPKLDTFEAEVAGSLWLTEDSAPSQKLNAMLNAPLSSTFAVRVAAVADHSAGWIDQPAARQKNINDQNLIDVRFQALWQPTSSLRVQALAEIHRNDTATSGGEDANGNYTQAFGETTSPSVKSDFDILNLTVSYDFGPIELISSTTHLSQRVDTREFGYIIPSGATILQVLNRPFLQETESTSQELRLTSTGTSRFRWTVGTYYRKFTYDYNQAFFFGATMPAMPSRNVSESRSESWAVFGDANYELFEKFTIGAGLRYYEDRQHFDTILPATTSQSGKFDNLSPRFYARYELADNVNLYGSASRGFRSGGFNSLSLPSYNPETVWTYEAGIKASLLDRRVGLELAAFTSNYKGYQVVGLTPAAPVNITSNAGDARIKGIEGSLNLSLDGGWSLGVNGNYVAAEFRTISATGTGFVIGDPLNLIPKYQLSAFVEKAFTLGDRDGFVRIDYNQVGRQSLKAAGAFWHSDKLNLLNAIANFTLTQGLDISLYGRNLLNDRGLTDPQTIYRYATRGRPRSYGVELRAKF